MIVCVCKGISTKAINQIIEQNKQEDSRQLIKRLQRDLKVGTDCGACLDCIKNLCKIKND